MKDIKLLVVLILLLGFIIQFQHSPLQKEIENFHQHKKFFHTVSSLQTLTHKYKQVVATQHSVPLGQLLYPDADQITRSANTVVLESTDDPAIITDWYKAVIQKNFSGKTFVQSTINEDVHNKLIGEGKKTGVSIEINKNQDQSFSTITVTISSS